MTVLTRPPAAFALGVAVGLIGVGVPTLLAVGAALVADQSDPGAAAAAGLVFLLAGPIVAGVVAGALLHGRAGGAGFAIGVFGTASLLLIVHGDRSTELGGEIVAAGGSIALIALGGYAAGQVLARRRSRTA